MSRTITIYRSLDYLSVTLRYSGLFGLVRNSLVQGQVITNTLVLFPVHSHSLLVFALYGVLRKVYY